MIQNVLRLIVRWLLALIFVPVVAFAAIFMATMEWACCGESWLDTFVDILAASPVKVSDLFTLEARP